VAAGAVVVGIATSQTREVLLEAGACCVVESFEELLEAGGRRGFSLGQKCAREKGGGGVRGRANDRPKRSRRENGDFNTRF
jgi:hypothetical protein